MMSLTMFVVLACTPSGVDTDPTVGDQQVTASLSDVVTSVVVLEWTTGSAEDGRVRWSVEGGSERETEATLQDDGSWRAVLVGAPEQTVVSWEVVNGDLSTSGETETGSAPSWVPDDPVLTGEPLDGFLVSSVRTPDLVLAMVADGQGRAVWWYPMDTYGTDALSSRTRLDPGGDGLWFNTIKLRSAPADADADLGVTRVSWDGTEVEYTELPSHHHDFLVRDDGTIAFLSYLEQEGGPQLDVLMEQAPGGEPEVLWNSEDVLTGEGQTAFLNTVEYVAATDEYWVSANALDLLAVLDASTGDTLGTVGGEGATVVVDDPFDNQHGFDVLGDELLLFDNGDAAGGDSRGVRYTLDWKAGTGTLTWSHHADPPRFSTFLGDALALPDGRSLVNWTTHGLVHVIDGEDIDTTWQYDDYEYLTFCTWAESL